MTPVAWRAVGDADLVACADAGTPLAAALTAARVPVAALPQSTARSLLTLAESQGVVWLAADDGDEVLTTQLASLVVRRSQGSAAGPEVEIIVGSFDPEGARLLDAVTVMDTLRRECPWDRRQTHASLVRYLVEETYEVIEVIDSMRPGEGSRHHTQRSLREELGDLLLQVLFHARLAAEHAEEPFTIDDVAANLVEKLVRRHPHVFADMQVSGADEVATNWEEIKRVEKGRQSALDGIPAGLPALSLADSVIGRVVRADGSLSVPIPEGEPAYTEETLGEVLFALVAAARAAGLDAEQALRAKVRREIAAVRAAESRPD